MPPLINQIGEATDPAGRGARFVAGTKEACFVLEADRSTRACAHDHEYDTLVAWLRTKPREANVCPTCNDATGCPTPVASSARAAASAPAPVRGGSHTIGTRGDWFSPLFTLWGIIALDPALSSLQNALAKANLRDVLDVGGDYTVFAPNNAAFRRLGATPTGSALVRVLKNHVVAGRVNSSAVPNPGDAATLTTLAGGEITVTRDRSTGDVRVEGARVAAADVPATNGVLHIVDEVLVPRDMTMATVAGAHAAVLADLAGARLERPTILIDACDDDAEDRETAGRRATAEAGVGHMWDGTAWQAIAWTARLSTLATALRQTDLADALDGPGPITVFAPTNTAFRTSQPVPISLEGKRNVLLNHVVQGTVRSSDVPLDGTPITRKSLLGGALEMQRVPATGDITVNGAKIILADFEASNGVVHVVNGVLPPKMAGAGATSAALAKLGDREPTNYHNFAHETLHDEFADTSRFDDDAINAIAAVIGDGATDLSAVFEALPDVFTQYPSLEYQLFFGTKVKRGEMPDWFTFLRECAGDLTPGRGGNLVAMGTAFEDRYARTPKAGLFEAFNLVPSPFATHRAEQARPHVPLARFEGRFAWRSTVGHGQVLPFERQATAYGVPLDTLLREARLTDEFEIAYTVMLPEAWDNAAAAGQNDDKTVILMLHGVPTNRKWKYEMMEIMARRGAIVVACDLLGMGESTAVLDYVPFEGTEDATGEVNEAYDWRHDVPWLSALIRDGILSMPRLGFDHKYDVVVAADDWGAGPAEWLFALEPEIVSHLVLISPIHLDGYFVIEIGTIGRTDAARRLRGNEAFEAGAFTLPQSIIGILKYMVRHREKMGRYTESSYMFPYQDTRYQEGHTAAEMHPNFWNLAVLAARASRLAPSQMQPYDAETNPAGLPVDRMPAKPVDYIHGVLDQMMEPAQMFATTYAFPRPRVQAHAIADADHFTEIDQPHRVADAMTSALLRENKAALPIFLGDNPEFRYKGDEAEKRAALADIYPEAPHF